MSRLPKCGGMGLAPIIILLCNRLSFQNSGHLNTLLPNSEVNFNIPTC